MKLFGPTPEDEQIIHALRQHQAGDMTHEAKDRILRSVLSSESATQPEQMRYVQSRGFFSFLHKPMIATLAIILVLALGTGTAAAANIAKPGDVLFGLDRAIEQVQLTLTVKQETRAKIAAQIAEEREKEQQELEDDTRQRSLAALEEAQQRSNTALERASEAVNDAREKLESHKNSGKAADALKKVEDTLTHLRERHAERLKKEFHGLTEAEVTISATSAVVKLEVDGKSTTYELATTVKAEIVAEIAKRSGVKEALIRSILRIKREQQKEKEDSITNHNTNRPTSNLNVNSRTNVNTNHNSNVNSINTNSPDGREDAHSSLRWTIEVRVRTSDGEADVRTEYGGDHHEWVLLTTNQALILTNISQRTGLASAEIISLWDFTVED